MNILKKFCLSKLSIERKIVSKESYKFAEGEKASRLAIAKAMKEKGIDIEVIVDCTGLTKEQVEAL